MPTRTPRTEQAYRERARQVAEAANAAAGRKLTAVELVQALSTRKLAPASFRQVRAALVFTMGELMLRNPAQAKELNAAIALLREARPKKLSDGVLRTSASKQKTAVEADLKRVCHAALATDTDNAEILVALLECGQLSGARLVEWPSAEFGPSDAAGFAWQLTLVNGKHGNGRAHGHCRTLRWQTLPAALVVRMRFWIAAAKQAAATDRYATLLDTLEALLRRLTTSLFPRRRTRPTVSSARHAAAARFKAAYVESKSSEDDKRLGRAIVAALLGHATDATASSHYARARAGSSRFPVPAPDPDEVRRIRRRFSAPQHRTRSTPAPGNADQTS